MVKLINIWPRRRSDESAWVSRLGAVRG
jgi:hypothetical protein